jgi:hypothetical protein
MVQLGDAVLQLVLSVHVVRAALVFKQYWQLFAGFFVPFPTQSAPMLQLYAGHGGGVLTVKLAIVQLFVLT